MQPPVDKLVDALEDASPGVYYVTFNSRDVLAVDRNEPLLSTAQRAKINNGRTVRLDGDTWLQAVKVWTVPVSK